MTSPGGPMGSVLQNNSVGEVQRNVSDTSARFPPSRDRASSPISTLRHILSTENNTANGADSDALLLHSLQNASSEDQKFAKYVLETTLRLQAWSDELQGWTWSGSFAHENSTNRTSSNKVNLHSETEEQASDYIARNVDFAQSGQATASSLTNRLATYVEPLRRIRESLEDVDITAMKSHVLDTYITPDTAGSANGQSDLLRSSNVGNFTALVTVVLLKALPHHLKVSSLAETWSARIAVSNLVPKFFTLFSEAIKALDQAWASIGCSRSLESTSDPPTAIIIKTEEDLVGLQAKLQTKVSSVGQVLDYMLDMVEGLDDTLPELWIDQVDELEEEYSDWTVAAKKWLIQQTNHDHQDVPVTGPPELAHANAEQRSLNGDQFAGSSYLADASESESEEKLVDDIDERSLFESSPLPDRGSDNNHPRKNEDLPISDSSPPMASTFFNSDDESSASDTDNDTIIQSQILHPKTVNSAKREGIVFVGDEDEKDNMVHSGYDGSRDVTKPLEVDLPKSDEATYSGIYEEYAAFDDEDDVEEVRFGEIVNEHPVVIDRPPLQTVDSQEAEQYESQEAESSSTLSSQQEQKQPLSTDEQLERKIDSILTSIPTRINFKRTRPAQSTHLRPSTPDARNLSGSRSVSDATNRPGTPALTLAPAETKEPRAAKSSGDSPIRLYYLWQAGRPRPIKLFVRLIGENGERVMVRVGGGWADLADYLREYATHHSRTIVPEPHEALQAVDLRQPSNSRVFSLPMGRPDTSQSSSPPRVDSPSGDIPPGSSPTQRISQLPSDSLQPLKTRLNSRSLKMKANLQNAPSSPYTSTNLDHHESADWREGTGEQLPSPPSSPSQLHHTEEIETSGNTV